MRRMLAVIFLVTAAMSLAAAQGAESKAAQDAKAVQEVRKLREQWGQAIVKHDVPSLEPLLADEFTETDAVGKVHDKKAYLDIVRSPGLVLESAKGEDEKIRVYGDTVTVTALGKLRGKLDGVDFSDSYRELRVFVKRDGRWLCVASQITRVAQP